MGDLTSSSKSSSKPRRVTQQERTESSRRKLVEAAVECISKEGFRAATLAAIADRAGVSRGLINYQFEDKNDLMAEVMRYRFERNAAAYDRTLSDIADPVVRVDRLVDTLIENNKRPEHMAYLEIVVAARSDPALAERIAPILHKQGNIGPQSIIRYFADLNVSLEKAIAIIQFSTAFVRGAAIEGQVQTKGHDYGPEIEMLRRALKREFLGSGND